MLSTTGLHGFSLNRRRRGIVMALLLLILASRLVVAEEPALYIVGPNDTLAVTVYDQPQLTGKFTVQADGSFAFPLLGRVKVGGLSVQAIENDLRERLARGYLKKPDVSVTVDQFRSQQIFVMGEVRSPGTLEFKGNMSIIEALARAGSTTDHAGFDVVIVHGPTDAAQSELAPSPNIGPQGPDAKDSNTIRLDLQSLQRGTLTQTVTLRAGDTIFVPRAETVIISGHVGSPGEKVIRRGTTVLQALAMAGGVTDRGSTGRIQIIRKVDGHERTLNANLQDVVQPDDTIVVRERFF